MKEPLKYFIKRTTLIGAIARKHRNRQLRKKYLLWENQGTEGTMPNYDCYEKLLGEPIDRKQGYVAHHMLMNKQIVLELLEKIEKRFQQKWYDAILDVVTGEKDLAFSEYETYGHYVQNHYSDKIRIWKPIYIQRFKMRQLLLVLFNLADYAAFSA
jgi:hypothetical protein